MLWARVGVLRILLTLTLLLCQQVGCCCHVIASKIPPRVCYLPVARLALSPPSSLLDVPSVRSIRKTKQAPTYTCTCYRLDTSLLLTRESHRPTGLLSGSLFGFGAPAGGGRSEEDKDGIAQESGHGKGGGFGGRRVLKVKGKKADSLGGEISGKEGE